VFRNRTDAEVKEEAKVKDEPGQKRDDEGSRSVPSQPSVVSDVKAEEAEDEEGRPTHGLRRSDPLVKSADGVEKKLLKSSDPGLVSKLKPPQSATSVSSTRTRGTAKSKSSSIRYRRRTVSHDSFPVDLEENTILSKFALNHSDIVMGEKIGAGAFGEVRKGRYNGLDVAIKILHSQDEKAMTMFRKEAELLAYAASLLHALFFLSIDLFRTLRHENIVPCVGFCLQAGHFWLVMEFMPMNLHDFIKAHHPLNPHVLRQVSLGIARGVSYLHSNKVIHRDLKPGNILLDASLNARIADFGVSREWADNLTMTKIGTPTYCAPEVLNGEKYSWPADMYSYGTTCSPYSVCFPSLLF